MNCFIFSPFTLYQKVHVYMCGTFRSTIKQEPYNDSLQDCIMAILLPFKVWADLSSKTDLEFVVE